MRLDVDTGGSTFAGTDHLVKGRVVRDEEPVIDLRLDYPNEDDLERGASRRYYYRFDDHFFDETEPLPDGISQRPVPYPERGLEFSNGLIGHLDLELLPGGDDAWEKHEVDIFIRRFQFVPPEGEEEGEGQPIDPHGFVWKEDEEWEHVGHFPRDGWLSQDSGEGYTKWILNV